MSDAKICVVGGGNFGTAIANILGENGHPCHLWIRDAGYADEVQRQRINERYLPGHKLSALVTATSDLEQATADAELVFVTVPSSSFRDVSRRVAPRLPNNVMLVSGTKGIEAPHLKLMSDILSEECPNARVGAISGPNLAEEIAARQYTATVVASSDDELNRYVQTHLHGRFFRVYASSDLYGVQLAGALKNIYAIVCGMAAALGVGQNTISLLMTRGLAEMSRFAVSLGANPMTFLGLAGVGDLMVTCTSPLSRNYQLGHRIGSGGTLESSLADLDKLAEGVNTLKVVHAGAISKNVYMPLVHGLYRVLFESQPISAVIATLMAAEQKQDVEFAAPS